MRAYHPVIRGGLLAALAVLCGTAQARTNAASSAPAREHHYSIRGVLEPLASGADSAGASMQLNGRLAPTSEDVDVQSGGDFAMMASIVYSPDVCYGDTIFRDGFDGT